MFSEKQIRLHIEALRESFANTYCSEYGDNDRKNGQIILRPNSKTLKPESVFIEIWEKDEEKWNLFYVGKF